jgi:acyl-coenzyme A thioesterase PaaI-like protein
VTAPDPGQPAALAPETAERVRASTGRQTMLTTLGVTIEGLESGYVELGLANRRDIMQQHGFVQAAAADSACGYAAYTLFPAGQLARSSNPVSSATCPGGPGRWRHRLAPRWTSRSGQRGCA